MFESESESAGALVQKAGLELYPEDFLHFKQTF
jgi:hypothetical protein